MEAVRDVISVCGVKLRKSTTQIRETRKFLCHSSW